MAAWVWTRKRTLMRISLAHLSSVKKCTGSTRSVDSVAGGLGWDGREGDEGGGDPVSFGLEHRTSCLGRELFAKEWVSVLCAWYMYLDLRKC